MIFQITSILISATNFLLAIFIIVKATKRPFSLACAIMAFAVSIWGLGGSVIAILPESNYNLAIFWWQVAYTGVISIPVLYTHLIFSFLNLNKRRLFIFIDVLACLFLFLNWYDNSRLFLGNLRFVFNQFYWHDWIRSRSIIYLVFYISFYWLLVGYSTFQIFLHFNKEKGLRHSQLKYLIMFALIGWLGGEFNFLPDFHIDLYPYLNVLLVIYIPVFIYATFRYKIIDVKIALTRAGIFVVVYTIVLGIPFVTAPILKDYFIDFLGSQWWMMPLILMALLATIGPFLYIYLQRKAEDQLLKEQRRYQNTLKQASVGMTRIRELRKLLDLIAHIVTKTVRISYAAIYLLNEDTNEYVVQVSRDKGRIPLSKISSNNPLIQWIMLRHDPLIYEEIKRMTEDTNNSVYKYAEENMRMLTASVIIPCFLENKLIGFFVLGDKISGEIYTAEDLSVFQVLASQAALAIENAEFYEEAKEMQVQIAQAEKMATVGTMADGLSHQINNRFHALSLIAGDTIDTIKMTDTANCTPEVRDMIKQISYALDRIQSNVMQGGEVVKGILKYTRKGEEAFEVISLDQILDGTLDMVQYKVKLSEIDIIRNYSKETPKIKGNLVQLQEAFFNFIDNGYDAIVERRDTLKEQGYRGRIGIFAEPKDKYLEVIVEDNGMGVKEDNIKKVFTPFFTTKISARKGTGLGLYVIKRIITDTHKGKINFESDYKVGTRFILELPMA